MTREKFVNGSTAFAIPVRLFSLSLDLSDEPRAHKQRVRSVNGARDIDASNYAFRDAPRGSLLVIRAFGNERLRQLSFGLTIIRC